MACAASVLLVFVFSGVTLGAFAVLTAVAVVRIFLSKAQTRTSLAPVGPGSYPRIHNLARTAAYRLNLDPVDVFVRQSPHLNAFTTGFGSQSWIVLESALLEALTPGELLFVIGHESGHVKQRHVLWQLLIGQTGGARVPLITTFFAAVFSSWSRAAEYTADRAGFLAVGDVAPCCTALMKIAAGPQATQEVSVEDLLESVESQNELMRAAAEFFRSHPLEGHRIQALISYSQSFTEQQRV